MSRIFRRLAVLLLILTGFAFASPGVVAAEVDFVEEVQPLLRRHCFRCHGERTQEANLRLDLSATLFDAADSGEPIVVPHDPDESLLLKRVVGDEYGEQMPPDSPPLSAAEIETLQKWVSEGAAGADAAVDSQHWAYQPIVRPALPELDSQQTSTSGNSPIDEFIRHRLLQKGLQPSSREQPASLLRRTSLVLTGLPPSLQELDDFLADPSPLAFERAVDRMLASEQFGQRWATPWLDLARYADSNGFQADQIRDNWAYRDWLIRSLNDDMPFDQFVIEQLAGDLLPNSTLDQRIATGFHRMTTCNVEAGVHPEANRVNQVVDRVNTTATVFLGTTLECAQCHDHKYDPFTQEDYYKLFAYFNNTPLEVKQTAGVTWDFYGPVMELPLDDVRQKQREQLQQKIQALELLLDQKSANSDVRFRAWLDNLLGSDPVKISWQPAVPESFQSTGNESFEIQDDGAVLIQGEVPDTTIYTLTYDLTGESLTAIRLETLTDPAIPGSGPGRGDARRTNFVLHELTCELVDGDKIVKLELENAQADFSQKNFDVAGAIDGDPKTAWAINPEFGKPHWASFTLKQPLSPRAESVRLRITLDQHYGQGRVIGKPRISFFAEKSDFLPLAEKLADSEPLRKAIVGGKLNAKQKKELRTLFDQQDPQLGQLQSEIASLRKQLAEIEPETTLVMQELEQPRETFVMLRGDYEQLGAAVKPGTPAALPELAEAECDDVELRGSRLELAQWLVSRDNPLLARVTVNRWWSLVFGGGLVTTPEDFGSQAEPPTHPKLLDWLACELIESEWSMKHVLRQIVLSETFCQQSDCSAESLEMDPANRWLARGPRYRLSAESIRDNALAISGMISNKMYGAPVMPHQPAGLWRSVGRNQPKWIAAEDENRFRRGLYVVFKRASPYPSFMNFDSPDRGSCTVQRATTNTPLQALTLLNDPAYVELALAFADRLLCMEAKNDRERLSLAMRLTVARDAEPEELVILERMLGDERQLLKDKPQLVKQRTNPQTGAIELQSTELEELAAWFTVTSVLLNLDETINL